MAFALAVDLSTILVLVLVLTSMETSAVRPLIRWAGSKTHVLPSLRAYWTGVEGRYVEPFAGSASLFFDLEPRRALLGDLNGELIGMYRALRREPSAVLSYLRGMPLGKLAYYRIRAIPPDRLSSVARAARFLYLNRCCFNGLYRTNKKGLFNVPYGPPKSGKRTSEHLVLRAAALLRRARFIHGDFETILASVSPGDLVYLDPPYAISKRRVFAEYGPSSFSTIDLDRLSQALSMLHSKGITFVITYADSPEARRMLKQWGSKRIWTRRNISGFAASRRGSYELLATNSAVGGDADGN